MGIRIVTNHHVREVVYAYELTTAERERIGLSADVDGYPEDMTAEYVRYRGWVYPLSDFSADWGMTRGTGLPSPFRGWDGYLSDSFFSGIVIRYARDGENIDPDHVVMGTFYVTDGE